MILQRSRLRNTLRCESSVDDETFIDRKGRKGMCSPRSLELVQETLGFLSTRARDQDVFSFFRELGGNFVSRRPLAGYFKERYEEVRVSSKGLGSILS